MGRSWLGHPGKDEGSVKARFFNGPLRWRSPTVEVGDRPPSLLRLFYVRPEPIRDIEEPIAPSVPMERFLFNLVGVTRTEPREALYEWAKKGECQ